MTDAFKNAAWFNEPLTWGLENNVLSFTTNPKTDFWRETFYGFIRDSGHLLGVPTGDGFTAQVRVKGRYRDLYDQAGLMVRIDETKWVKAGVEFTDGQAFLSTVVTDGKSDWSVAAPVEAEEFYVRITLAKGAVRIQSSTDGVIWPLLRLASFPPAETYLVGPTACSPQGSGLKVQFSEFSVAPAKNLDLHDLS